MLTLPFAGKVPVGLFLQSVPGRARRSVLDETNDSTGGYKCVFKADISAL